MSAARVTAGASDSIAADAASVSSAASPMPVSGPSSLAVSLPSIAASTPPAASDDPDSIVACVQHIDFGGPASLSCSTYRQSFSMLDETGAVKRRVASVAVQIHRASGGVDTRHRRLQPRITQLSARGQRATQHGPGRIDGAQRGGVGVPGGRPEPRGVAGLQGPQRQPADVQRTAGRRAAPAARPRFREADRRAHQRHRDRLPDDLRQGAARRVDQDEQLRRVRLRPAVDGRLRRAGLPARPDRQGQRRREPATGRTSARSSAISTRPTTARSTRSRWTATSTWSITGAICWPRTGSSRRRPGTTT